MNTREVKRNKSFYEKEDNTRWRDYTRPDPSSYIATDEEMSKAKKLWTKADLTEKDGKDTWKCTAYIYKWCTYIDEMYKVD